MSEKKQSPRQELDGFANNGYLRGILEISSGRPSAECVDLIVKICLDYCTPRRKRTKRG